MLKLLRKHRKGFFGGIVLGLVSLTMIGFGIEFFAGRGRGGEVIRIGNTEISSVEYYRRLNMLRDRYRNQFGAQYDQIAQMLNLEQQTVDQLINTELLQDLLDSIDLSASPREIGARIQAHPFFQGQPPTKASYRSFLRALGMSGVQLEQMTAQELASQQLLSTLTDINVFSDQELTAVYRDINREASFNYVAFEPAAFRESVEIESDEVLEAYYIDHDEQYRKPRSVRISAVLFSPSEFMSEVEVTEEDVSEYYERNRHKYMSEKKVKFRRMLFKKSGAEKSPLEQMVTGSTTADEVKEQQANDALKRLKDDASFAELAAELSEDQSTKAEGGMVGWTEYRVLQEDIRKALNRLDIGEHSNVVETDDGYYLLMVEDIQEQQPKKLDEVRSEVEQSIRAEYAPEYARAAAEHFIDLYQEEATNNPDLTLEEFAEINGRQAVAGERLLSRGQAAEGLAPSVTAEALTLAEGEVTVTESERSSVVLQTVELKPSHIPEFEEVKEQVEQDYRTARANELAKEHAEAALAKLQEGGAEPGEQLAAAAKEYGLEVQTTASGTRSSIQDPLLSVPTVKQAAFALSSSNPLGDSLVQAGDAYYLLALASESFKEADSFEEQRAQLAAAEAERAAARLEAVLIKELRSEADIWVDPNLLDEAAG